MIDFDNIQFAEIEIVYDADNDANPLRGPLRRPAPQPVDRRGADPLREKFYAMRSLAYKNPFARNDPLLFYRQAKFMEDFSDHYPGGAEFNMYYPCYQHMGYEQLRVYFSWRTRVRLGDIKPAQASYIFLYIYELLAGIGADGPADGLDRLMSVWGACRDFVPVINNYMPGWLKDYHIYYAPPRGFRSFVDDYGLRGLYPELCLYDAGSGCDITGWNAVSNYDVSSSGFFKAGNGEMMTNCFNYVLRGVAELCAANNTRIEILMSAGAGGRFHWKPFARALFHNRHDQPDRKVEMPGGEIYYCRDSRWTVNTCEQDTERRAIVGYMIKKTEECLRRAAGYKYRLKTDPGQAALILNKSRIGFDKFNAAIEQAVAGFYRDMTRTVVTVDHGNLSRIRDEALKTQDKLTVDEEKAAGGLTDGDGYGDGGGQYDADGDGYGDGGGQYDADMDGYGDGGGQYNADMDDSTDDSGGQYDADGWLALKEALSEAELGALAIALNGGSDIRAFAGANGVMPEVLVDGINEKAADYIGDNILDSGETLTVYAEYIKKVGEIII